MTTPALPSTLPGVSSLKWGPVPQVMSTEREIGPVAYRRFTQVPAALASVTWRFLEGDFAIFQEFWKNDLLRGHRWFTLVLPCGAGYATHVVRFRTHRTANVQGYAYKEVSAELYVRERKLRQDVVFTYITSTPYPIYTLESLDISGVVLSGSLSSLFGFADDSMDISSVPLSGELRVALHVGYGSDYLDTTFDVLSGSLVSVLITYDAGHEDLQASISPLSGSIRVALVQNTIPAESIQSEVTVISGSLVTP